MKKFLFLTLTLITSVAFTLSLIVNKTKAYNDVVDTYFVVNCRKSITLRSEPSVYAPEITQIPLGQAVGFIGNAGNGFYKINYDGLVGYALAQYLSPNRGERYSARMARVVNCDNWISLREYPDTYSVALARIPRGAYVTYLGKAGNGFYHIEYRGISGYALQVYLELQ
ncbi:MAG: SH3 domain-containing protein [Selenomonadaceae bacterium]|nr:SH3 domain-containing protein [Selenomonadaceae bacterium]